MSDKDVTPLEKPITAIEEQPIKKRTKRDTPDVEEALKKATEGKREAAQKRLAQKKIDAARLLLEHDRKTRPKTEEEAPPKFIHHRRPRKIVLVEESSGESDSEDISSDDSSEDEPIIIQRKSRPMVSQQRQSTVAPRKQSKQVKPPVTHQSVPVVKDWSAYLCNKDYFSN
jgi:hypothetical protein